MTEALRLAWAVGPRLFAAAALEGLAALGAQREQAELAVRLLAAAAALREQMGTPVRPLDRARVDQAQAATRSILGTRAFAAVWEEAQALPLEQILSTIFGVAMLDVLRDRTAS